MLYTIGEMAKTLGVPTSTLRFYEKKGLLPFVERSSGGIRMFTSSDYECLKIIECLKKSGMSLKDIAKFIQMVMQGDKTIDDRLKMFLKRRQEVEKQIEELNATLKTINYKCWYYETAKKAGTTDVPENMSVDEIPNEFKPIKEYLTSE